MKPTQLAIAGCIVSALTVLPGASAAVRKCVVQKSTPASYTWNFQQEAGQIFKEVRFDAAQARRHAEELKGFAEHADAPGWRTDAEQLNEISSEVDNIGSHICRLEAIRRVTAPWQQKAIDHIAVDLRLLADNTQDAISFGQAHREALWMPTYQEYLDNLYAQSRNLERSVDMAIHGESD